MAQHAFSTPEGSSKKATFPMHLLSMWTGHFYPTQVLVPAAVIREIVSFDFRTTVETIPELKGLTEESMNSIVALLLRQFQNLESTDFEGYLRASGLGDVEITDNRGERQKLSSATLKTLSDRLVRTATESGLSTLYLRDALTEDLADFKIDSAGMNWSSLLSAVEDFQEYYAKLTQSVPGGELVPLMTTGASANSIVRFVYALRRSMNQTTVPAIPARLSYVIDNIQKAMFGDGWLFKEEIIPGLEYRLSPEVWSSNELTFETCYLAYIGMLRSFMGFASPTETYRVSPKELANSLTESMGQLVPALPVFMKDKADWSLLTDPGQAKNLIVRIWTAMVISRVTSNEPSMTASRAASLMDFRKYKNDEFTAILEDLLQVYGIIVDAYMDTAVFFRDLVHQQRLYFSTPHPKDRLLYTDFIENLIKPYSSFTTPVTSPRYMKEGAHLITHSRPVSVSDLTPLLIDKDRSMKNSVMVNIDSGERKEWRHTSLLSGSLLNVKTPLNLSVYLQLAQSYAPRYITKLPVSNFLNEHSLFKTLLGIYPLEDLMRSSAMAKTHLAAGQLVHALTASDLASLLRLPFEIAVAKFKAPGIYWVADSIASAIFWVGGDEDDNANYLTETGVFYVDEIVNNDARRFESFAAVHPFFLELSSEVGVDASIEKLATDLPTTLELNESVSKGSGGGFAHKEPIDVPITSDDEVDEVKKTEESPVTSNQMEETKGTKPGSFRKGKSANTKEVEGKKEAPNVEPKTGFEWTKDENSGEWIQTKIAK